MNDQILQSISKLRLGSMLIVHSAPNIVSDIISVLPDYGVEAIEIKYSEASEMIDAEQVEKFNNIRLDGRVALLTGIEETNSHAMQRFADNFQKCFLTQGGKAVLIA